METAPPPLGSFVMLQARFHRHFGGDRRQSDYRGIPNPAWGQALREPLPKQFFEKRAGSHADKRTPGHWGGVAKAGKEGWKRDQGWTDGQTHQLTLKVRQPMLEMMSLRR